MQMHNVRCLGNACFQRPSSNLSEFGATISIVHTQSAALTKQQSSTVLILVKTAVITFLVT